MYSLFFLYLSEQIYKIMKIKLLLISFLLAANALGAAAQVNKTYYVRWVTLLASSSVIMEISVPGLLT